MEKRRSETARGAAAHPWHPQGPPPVESNGFVTGRQARNMPWESFNIYEAEQNFGFVVVYVENRAIKLTS